MNIAFEDKKLQKILSSQEKANKTYGKQMAQRLFARLNAMAVAETLAELLPPMPGRFHSLHNDRKGCWACDLGQPYRLIFRPTDRTLTEARYIEAVTIIEIVDYH